MAKLLERTEKVYETIIRKYEQSGKDPEEFVLSIKGSESFRRLCYYVLKRYCEENGIEFTLDIKDLPKETPDLSLIQKGLTKEDIIKMIYAVKGSNYPASKTFMALSTTYGTRCVELLRITENDIDLGRKLILIKTAKSGEPRIHKIPDQILPYLYGFKPVKNQLTLWQIFHKSFKLAGINTNGYGYHDIRKCLFTELINNGARYEFAEYFLRWKLGGRVSFQHYFIPEVDRVAEEIFKYHPFIKEWE